MKKASDVDAITISLEAGDAQALFILTALDGSINRMGTGTVDNKEHSLCIGVTDDPIFLELRKKVSDGMLEYMGGYDVPEKRGVPCRLSISFRFSNGTNDGFRFSYGSESQGPPSEIVDIIISAVRLTEPWYQKQMTILGKGSKKPWWRFW